MIADIVTCLRVQEYDEQHKNLKREEAKFARKVWHCYAAVCSLSSRCVQSVVLPHSQRATDEKSLDDAKKDERAAIAANDVAEKTKEKLVARIDALSKKHEEVEYSDEFMCARRLFSIPISAVYCLCSGGGGGCQAPSRHRKDGEGLPEGQNGSNAVSALPCCCLSPMCQVARLSGCSALRR